MPCSRASYKGTSCRLTCISVHIACPVVRVVVQMTSGHQKLSITRRPSKTTTPKCNILVLRDHCHETNLKYMLYHIITLRKRSWSQPLPKFATSSKFELRPAVRLLLFSLLSFYLHITSRPLFVVTENTLLPFKPLLYVHTVRSF